MLKMLKLNKFYNKLIRIFKFSHFSISTCIKDVEHYEGKVYNLSINSDETYMADGFVVHNCRSTIIPSIISTVQSNRRSKEARSDESYGDWLRKQPKSFQDEYFSKLPDGERKARLFRMGKLPIDKFSDSLGAEYSLAELQNLNPVAFERSGLKLE